MGGRSVDADSERVAVPCRLAFRVHCASGCTHSCWTAPGVPHLMVAICKSAECDWRGSSGRRVQRLCCPCLLQGLPWSVPPATPCMLCDALFVFFPSFGDRLGHLCHCRGRQRPYARSGIFRPSALPPQFNPKLGTLGVSPALCPKASAARISGEQLQFPVCGNPCPGPNAAMAPAKVVFFLGFSVGMEGVMCADQDTFIAAPYSNAGVVPIFTPHCFALAKGSPCHVWTAEVNKTQTPTPASAWHCTPAATLSCLFELSAFCNHSLCAAYEECAICASLLFQHSALCADAMYVC